MSKLYSNVNNPLCSKGCDVNRAEVLTLAVDSDYYKFTFVIVNNKNELKDTLELIKWLNTTPKKEFFIIDAGHTWSVYLHEDDAVLWKMKWW